MAGRVHVCAIMGTGLSDPSSCRTPTRRDRELDRIPPIPTALRTRLSEPGLQLLRTSGFHPAAWPWHLGSGIQAAARHRPSQDDPECQAPPHTVTTLQVGRAVRRSTALCPGDDGLSPAAQIAGFRANCEKTAGSLMRAMHRRRSIGGGLFRSPYCTPVRTSICGAEPPTGGAASTARTPPPPR